MCLLQTHCSMNNSAWRWSLRSHVTPTCRSSCSGEPGAARPGGSHPTTPDRPNPKHSSNDCFPIRRTCTLDPELSVMLVTTSSGSSAEADRGNQVSLGPQGIGNRPFGREFKRTAASRTCGCKLSLHQRRSPPWARRTKAAARASRAEEATQRWAHSGRQHSERFNRHGRSWPRGAVRLEEVLLAR